MLVWYLNLDTLISQIIILKGLGTRGYVFINPSYVLLDIKDERYSRYVNCDEIVVRMMYYKEGRYNFPAVQ